MILYYFERHACMWLVKLKIPRQAVVILFAHFLLTGHYMIFEPYIMIMQTQPSHDMNQ